MENSEDVENSEEYSEEYSIDIDKRDALKKALLFYNI